MKGVKHYTKDGEYNGPTHKMDGEVHTGKTHTKTSKVTSHKPGGPFKMNGSAFYGKGNQSPVKKYVSDAQRKAVHAGKADGGAGNPNKMVSPVKGKLKPCQKTAAKKKFKVYPSAYANMWASNHKC